MSDKKKQERNLEEELKLAKKELAQWKARALDLEQRVGSLTLELDTIRQRYIQLESQKEALSSRIETLKSSNEFLLKRY